MSYLFLVSPHVVGIGSEYFVVYLLCVYIDCQADYVELPVILYLLFNVWYITCCPNEKKYQLETRFARIIRYGYSLYVLRSRASRSRCSIPGISGRVDMLTSPVPAARGAVPTGAWVESKHDMYLMHTWKCGSSSFILEKSVVYNSTWYLVRYMQAPNRLYKSEVRASVLRVKTPCEQGLPHCT